jgi:pyruvate-formate lyase-activating enzyme
MSEPVPAGAELRIRALFDDEGGRAFDERRGRLDSDDPSRWEGVAFPVEFALELAAVCNLACVMCPVPTTSRKARLMDETLFRKVVDEVASEKGYVLFPQGFGESMLHPKWADLLGHARAKGVRPIVVLTNGTLLNEKNVARLLSLDVDAVVVSIDGVAPETYAKVRVGGDLHAVEANVRRFLAARGPAPRPRLVLRIIRMKETAAEIAAFFERWRPLLGPADEIAINEFNDWAGKVEDRSEAPRPEPAAAGPARPPCRVEPLRSRRRESLRVLPRQRGRARRRRRRERRHDSRHLGGRRPRPPPADPPRGALRGAPHLPRLPQPGLTGRRGRP